MSQALPSGWSAADLRATEDIARIFRADPRGILAIWNSESGLYPRLDSAGYYGLIMGRDEFVSPAVGKSPGYWISLVKNGPVADQIKTIGVFWQNTARHVLGGDDVGTRARKLGIRGDTMLYALNFVPAYAAKMTSRTQPMVIRGGGPDGGVFYRDNPGFDLDGKGYINLIDVEKRIDSMKAKGATNARTAPLFASIAAPWSWWEKALVGIGLGALVYGGGKVIRR